MKRNWTLILSTVLNLGFVCMLILGAGLPSGGGGDGNGICDSTGCDFDSDGTNEITVNGTTIAFDPTDSGTANATLAAFETDGFTLLSGEGFLVQRTDTTAKDVWEVTGASGNQLFGDEAEGTFDVFAGTVRAIDLSSTATQINGGTTAGDQVFIDNSGVQLISTGGVGTKVQVFDAASTFLTPIEHDKTTGDTITEPFACAAATTGSETQVDDTNDGLLAVSCICIDLDDGSTFDWRRADDNATACPYM